MALFEPGRDKTGGRRAGARNKISTKLLEAFAEDFEAHGIEAIKITRCERPAEYLKICAALVPQAFDETAPLGLAITQIQRTIIDAPQHLEPVPETNRIAVQSAEVVTEEKKSELAKLLEETET